MNCPLCESTSNPFHKTKFRNYLRCTSCMSIFIEKSFLPTKDEENKRYLEHKNDVYDLKYQNFLKPIVEKVLQFQKPDDEGLDFGAGSHSAIEYLLKQNGYSICIYDPFFHPYNNNLLKTYDYITLTEVVEHFHSPKLEFQKLKGLLNPNGSLYILTHPYDDEIDFENWYYKNDKTHTFFYTKESFEWILNHYGFKNLEIEGRIIQFQK
ncbi:class I SAM-dependent methyltransferase [Leptospira noumeaensis]|uniref:Class I SAM-dependent methyltransferase n=1 Tax=Leptospira noumeaensis TaxID=2484964 RepID=A0A4R9I1E9_9LEPT|nr:class I SAM-dependent methyltransferase [Leptospira noumeaensis]TGK79059.1 class I SAM-dependent methyltransferase [Leptospira noumeaensis]